MIIVHAGLDTIGCDVAIGLAALSGQPWANPEPPWAGEPMAPVDEAYQDEMGAAYGDPRRCPRHPHVRMSSSDGMFDGLCGACEAEMDFEDES